MRQRFSETARDSFLKELAILQLKYFSAVALLCWKRHTSSHIKIRVSNWKQIIYLNPLIKGLISNFTSKKNKPSNIQMTTIGSINNNSMMMMNQ